MKWRNKKNNETYIMFSDRIVNKTNENDDQEMVLYFKQGERKMYVREIEEFYEKFEKVG